MRFFDFFKLGSRYKKPSIDLTDYKFISVNHVRIQNGQKSNTNNKGAWRGIRIQSSDNLIFIVTIYNLVGTHLVWGDNIQMSPKQMKFIEENNEKIFLRGFGTDQTGASFSDYGLTLHKVSNIIELVTLHMYDRNIDIIYSRGNPNEMDKVDEEIKSTQKSMFFGNKKIDENEKLFQLATTSYLDNDVTNALKIIDICLKSGSIEKWEYFAFRANCLEENREYKKAIEDYETAIKLNNYDENVYALYHQIGLCYLNLNNNEKAVEFYTYALQLKNQLQNKGKEDLEGLNGGVLVGVSFKKIYNNRGNALKNLNQFDDAITDCEKAIKYDENYSNPYLLLSQIHSLKGDDEEAIKNLELSAILGNQFAIKTIANLISDGKLTEESIKRFFDRFSRFSDKNSMIFLIELLNSKRTESAYANYHLKTYLNFIEFSAISLRNENALSVLKLLGG